MTQGKVVGVRLNATELAKMDKRRGDKSISMGRFIKECAIQASPSKAQVVRLKQKVDDLQKQLDARNVEMILIKDKLQSTLDIIKAGE